MMCTMQNHIIQVFANSGNVIKPIGVLNELKSKWRMTDAVLPCEVFTYSLMTGGAVPLFTFYNFGGKKSGGTLHSAFKEV